MKLIDNFFLMGKVAIIVIGYAGIAFGCTSVNVQNDEYKKLDLTTPGHSQDDLDADRAASTVNRIPWINAVLKPEYLIAYSAAVDHLNEVGNTKGYGTAKDYLIGFGEYEDKYVISFGVRIRSNSAIEIEEALRSGRKDWRAFYNTGEYPPLIMTISKIDFTVKCVGEIASQCISASK